MPTYVYRCTRCGEITEEVRKIDDRQEPAECRQPYCEGTAEFEFCPPHDTAPREIPEQGVIYSEKQLERDWRDKGTTRREGGCGRTLTFDQRPAR